MEVEAILHLRRVGVAELLVERLLCEERLVVFDGEGDVMKRAGAEAPTARRQIGFMVQVDDAPWPTPGGREPVVWSIDTDPLEAQGVDEELFLFLDAAHRHHGAEEAARGDVRADVFRRPRSPEVVGFDDFVVHARRMAHLQILPSEPLLHPPVLDRVAFEMFFPEGDRSGRNGVAQT